ncbi:MAG TPA: caspase family protein [Acidimicrobiales bacterium]
METTRAALVVAAYEFDDPRFQRLRSPARDVDALAGVLGDPAIGGFTVQSVVNQSGPTVQQELERFFSGRKPDDLLLVYFSCHGVKDATGRLYFATTNTTFDLLRSTGISASFVSEQMELTRSKRIVLLLDCCYSGAFLKGFRARGDDSVGVNQLEGRGRAVITASRSTEYAFEADELTEENALPSVFTGAIIEGLSTGAADRDGDGVVTVDELYDFVYDHVRGKVAGQTPGRWVNLEGELVVARNPRPPVRPAELPGELRKAVESEVAIYRLGAVWQLKQWFEEGEPGQRLAAKTVLEQLTQDYDQRVREATTAVLAAATATPTETAPPALIPSPKPEPAPESTPAPEPEPTPAPVDAATEPESTPGPVDTAEAVESEPAGPAVGGGFRGIGWWLVVGVVGSVLALFLPLAPHDIGPDGHLTNDGWYVLWILSVGGIVAYAAWTFLGEGRPSGVGVALTVGLVPSFVGMGIGTVAISASLADDYVTSPGPGFFLLMLGNVALLVAAVLTLLRSRPYLALPARSTSSSILAGVIAAAMGAAAIYGLSEFTIRHYHHGNLDVQVGQIWNLIWCLLALTASVCLASGWIHDHVVRGKIRIVVTMAAYAVVAVAFLLAVNPTYLEDALVLAWFITFAVGAVAVPFVAMLVLSRRLGAVILAAWALEALLSTMSLLDEQGSTETSATTSFVVALVAALVAAGVLWQADQKSVGRGVP